MPIVIPKDIPAFSILEKENIFVMSEARAIRQDIRTIEIAVVNLMPTKIETETQLIRLLSNSPLQVNITFINTETYTSTHTAKSHLERFYKYFSEIKHQKFDGMIITGAPVEQMEFEDVTYWKELQEIMEFAHFNVTSTIYICWGAQAALYHYYKIKKFPLKEKISGVYKQRKQAKFEVLMNGIDDIFYMPHSRYTTIDNLEVEKHPDLICLGGSNETGISIIKSCDNKKIFITGHLEYDKFTLKQEYMRDISRGLEIKKPENYFSDETLTDVDVLWRSTANILFSNWLNYYVYQVTPYEFK